MWFGTCSPRRASCETTRPRGARSGPTICSTTDGAIGIPSDLKEVAKVFHFRRIDRWRLLLLPDHPTPLRLKTHTTDSVPYLLVDSATDGPGGIYTEPATADAIAVPGHELMSRLIART